MKYVMYQWLCNTRRHVAVTGQGYGRFHFIEPPLTCVTFMTCYITFKLPFIPAFFGEHVCFSKKMKIDHRFSFFTWVKKLKLDRFSFFIFHCLKKMKIEHRFPFFMFQFLNNNNNNNSNNRLFQPFCSINWILQGGSFITYKYFGLWHVNITVNVMTYHIAVF